MIYTEEDLKQAYTMGYNEAVDDVNAYIEQDSMEFSLDESYDDTCDTHSVIEDMVANESAETSRSAIEEVITEALSKDKKDRIMKKHLANKFEDMDPKQKEGAVEALIKQTSDKIGNKTKSSRGEKRSDPHYHLKIK